MMHTTGLISIQKEMAKGKTLDNQQEANIFSLLIEQNFVKIEYN